MGTEPEPPTGKALEEIAVDLFGLYNACEALHGDIVALGAQVEDCAHVFTALQEPADIEGIRWDVSDSEIEEGFIGLFTAAAKLLGRGL